MGERGGGGGGGGAIWGICVSILTSTWFELTDRFKDLRSIPVSVLTCRNKTPMDLNAAEWSQVQIVIMYLYSDSKFFTVAASANRICSLNWMFCMQHFHFYFPWEVLTLALPVLFQLPKWQAWYATLTQGIFANVMSLPLCPTLV